MQCSRWRSTRIVRGSIARFWAVTDSFIAFRGAKMVKFGKAFLINGTVYRRTKTGLVIQ